LETHLEKSGRHTIEVLSLYFHGGIDKNRENHVMVAGVSAEARTEHHPNTNIQYHHYTILLMRTDKKQAH
jgi:hypothetical protein